jgi:alanine racemase
MKQAPDEHRADTGAFSEACAAAFVRPNFFQVDLGAIRRCTLAIRSAIPAPVKLYATLKANAYGFGLLPVARTVVAAGVDGISLISLDDAIALRAAGITCPILLYAGVPLERPAVEAIERYGLIPSLHDEESFAALRRNAKGPLDCAVKVDAGQERIGVAAEKAGDFIARVAASGNLRVAIVNTHPYLSGGADADGCLRWQFERFDRACRDAEARGVHVPLRVMASSKVLRMTREFCLDAVDPGQALFSPLSGDASECQPFAALTSRLIEVKPIERARFADQAPFGGRSPQRLGVVPIGYSDGIHRLNAGVVLVGGRRAALLGQPSIEYTRVDLTDAPQAKVGDEVVFIGSQNGARIAPEEVMAKQQMSRLTDLAVEIRPAIQRIYVSN